MKGTILLYLLGAVLRLGLMNTDTLADTIRSRVELSTPLNAWVRGRLRLILRAVASHIIALVSSLLLHFR